MMTSSKRIGVDLGGTKIEAILLEEDGSISTRKRASTPAGDYDATLDAVVDLISSLGDEGATIGIGTPGAISPATGLMKNCNSTCLNDRPLLDDLQAKSGRSIRMANDADCFALSEAVDGAASGDRTVFGVILGTGVGGGIVVDGRLLAGPNAIAGEWGHNPLPQPMDSERPGPHCYCGRDGCIETFLSGPALSRQHARLSGTSISVAELVSASATDRLAEESLRAYEDRLARALGSVINLLDPDVIVLGGGLSNVDRLYMNVPRIWSEYVFSDRVDTRLVPPRYGDSSGVRGAAWLWPAG